MSASSASRNTRDGRRPPRVAVLGGGFAGLYAATYLAASEGHGSSGSPPEVTLVSEANHFTFTPLLAEVVGGSLGQEHVTFAHRVMAHRRGYGFRLGRVEGLDVDRGIAGTTSGEVRFDYAVVAFGARPRWFGNEELARRSHPLATVRDALRLRNRVLCQVERAVEERSPARRRRLLTFVVAGAGPAGVETGSEIWHLLSGVLPRYHDVRTDPRVVIVEAGDRILAGWDDGLAAEGLVLLRRSGMDIRLGTRVSGYEGEDVRLKGPEGEETLEAGTLVWTAGTEPATAPVAGSALGLTGSGHLKADEYLRVDGAERVFAAGDAASMENPRTGRPFPPVAPIAISQGIRAAGNIENALAGRPLEPYQAHHAGKIVSLGCGVALVDLLGFRIRGRAAWALYRTAYVMKLVGAKNKVRTAVTLLLNRVFERDLTIVSP